MTISSIWIVLAGIAVLFLVMVLQRPRKAQARSRLHEACRDLALRRGLSFELTGKNTGPRQHFRFVSADTGLSLTVMPSGESARRESGTTVMHLQTPTLDGGLAIYSSQLHPDMAKAIATFSGFLDNPLARRALGKVLGDDLAGNLGTLQSFPAPGGVELSVLADADPHGQFDPHAIARAIEDGPRCNRGQPRMMIVLSRTGMDLRVALALTKTEEIDRLLDQGLALQADLLSH